MRFLARSGLRSGLLLEWLVVTCSVLVHGQVSNPSIITVTTNPGGSCTANLPWQYNITNGAPWYCGSVSGGAGTWTQFGTGGGGGSVSLTSPNSTLSLSPSPITGTGTLDLVGSAGEIMAGATPALTYTPTLGKSGTAGTLALFPASGNFTTTLASAATASNTVDFFASAPTTGDLIECVTSSTTCTLTDAGVLAANVVLASSPGAGVAHFAGSTQTVTSSTIATGDIAANAVTLAKLATQGANTVLANVTSGTAVPTAASIPAGVQFYTSGTGYSAATSANLLGVCTTCVTSASSLTSNAMVLGGGSQASKTVAGLTTDGTSILTLGVAGTSVGAVAFNNATSGTVTLETATGAITSYTIQLPVAQPSGSNTFLSCTAASPAVCTWAAGGGGGTTTNALTGNNSNSGAASGSTFNGSGAVTFSANTFGAGSLANANTWSAANTISTAGAASTPALSLTGAPYTGGSATTNFPLLYLNDGTGPTTFSAAGTEFGINTPNGFTGNLEDYHINGGPSVFQVTYQGNEIISQTSSTQFALNLQNTTAATSSVAQSSPYDIRAGQFWYNPEFDTVSPPVVAASASDCWSHQVIETNGSNGASTYTLVHNNAVDNCVGSPSSAIVLGPYYNSYGMETTAIAQATSPTVVLGGGSGSGTTWTYGVLACVGPQCSGLSSTTTFSGPSTINTTNWNKVTWAAVTNADYYEVFRTVAGGTPSTTGGICLIPAGATLECDDKGLTGDATTAQAWNSTGAAFIGGGPNVGGGTAGGSFGTNGTVPSHLVSSSSGWYGNSANTCFDIVNGTTDIGCALAESTVIATNTVPKTNSNAGQMVASSITDNATKVSTAEFMKTGNTQLLTSNSSGITATTPGTTIFTWGALPASTNYSFHCSMIYSQATGAAANGIAVQSATNAATRWDAWGVIYTTNPSSTTVTASMGSAQNITSTTATSVVSATPGATGTVYQATLDGTIQVGASAGTLNVNVYTGNASDAVTVQAGSYCTLMP